MTRPAKPKPSLRKRAKAAPKKSRKTNVPRRPTGTAIHIPPPK